MTFIKIFILTIFFTQSIFTTISAKDVYYHLKANYFCGAPDGVTVCHILGFNGQFPGPLIEADNGDTLHITVHNGIRKQGHPNTTVHWHGLFQIGSPFEDGPTMVTQCPIPNGHSQTYVFTLAQAGTYWYHSHVGSQYTEGLWGPLIIHNKPEVYRNDYDDELVIMLSDWSHTSGQTNIDWFLSPASGGNEPIPFSVLMNGRGRYPCNATSLPCNPRKQVTPIFNVHRGKRYRIRVINTSAMASFFFSIEDHTLTTIEIDGVDTVKVPFHRVPIAAAQRYSFIVEMNSPKNEYWIRAEADLTMFNFDDPNINPNPEALNPVVKGKLKYHGRSRSLSELEKYSEEESQDSEPIDTSRLVVGASIQNVKKDGFSGDKLLQPYDKILAPANFDQEILLNVEGVVDDDGVNHLTFNNVTYKIGDTPLLGLVMHDKPIPHDANPFTTGYNKVVQIVLNNHDTGPHPFHLHGHTFWIVGIGATDAGDYDPKRDQLFLNWARRDTVVVNTGSWIVLRFITNNPGVWYFHCHINWHLESGLAMTVIEAPRVARKTLKIPLEAQRICQSVGVEL